MEPLTVNMEANLDYEDGRWVVSNEYITSHGDTKDEECLHETIVGVNKRVRGVL